VKIRLLAHVVRGVQMYEFWMTVCDGQRRRDFRGIFCTMHFDGRGNYNIGVKSNYFP
jgi:ribosomal protein L5